MNKPLVISGHYQSAVTNGQLDRTFFKELAKRGFEPQVVCGDLYSTLPVTSDNVHVIHLWKADHYLSRILSILVMPDFSYLYDLDYMAWRHRALRLSRSLISDGTVDYIHTIARPISDCFVGLKLKEETGLPWVAQFYEPWYDNSYFPYKFNRLKEINYHQELKVARKADIIIHSNNNIAEIWRERYGKEIAKKIKVVPFNFSISGNKKVKEHQPGTPITISHIGSFTQNRTSEVFIQAVELLLEQHPTFRKKIRVNFVGNVTEVERSLIPKKHLDDIFVMTGKVSEGECEEYYENSDVFLVMDGVMGGTVFFPSKILKYFYYEKPILGITPKGSPTEQELVNAGHKVFRNDDVDGICQYLETAVTDYPSLTNFNHEYWKKFSPKNVVDCFLDAIKSLNKQ